MELSKARDAEVHRREIWEKQARNPTNQKQKSKSAQRNRNLRRNKSATQPVIAAGRPSGKGLHLLGFHKSRQLPRGHLPDQQEIARSKVVGSARKIEGKYLKDWEWQRMCGHCDLPKPKRSKNKSVQATSSRYHVSKRDNSQRSKGKGIPNFFLFNNFL